MNLRTLFEQLRVPVKGSSEHRNVRRGWIGVCCPFCDGGAGKFHLAFPEQGGTGGNCWQCGPKRLWDVLIAFGLDRQQAAEAMSDLSLKKLPQAAQTKGRYRPPPGVGPLGTAHTSYLLNRGVGPARAASWGIQGIGLAGRLAWSLFLPVVRHGAEMSWTTRSVGKGGRRYVSAAPDEEAEPIKTLLYGEDFARNSVVVVEGPMDAVRVGSGAVATFGLNVTAAQVARIAAFPLRAICMDNEERAQRVGERLCRELSAFPGETVRVQLESGDDPGSADPEEIAELRQKFLEV